jgi:putative DNA primase/helicase
VLTLPSIDSRNRLSEADYWQRLDGVRPAVLGALLTAVSGALRRQHEIRLADLPRMADFVIWVTAAEEALGLAPGTMKAAYNRNRMESNEMALESCPLVPAIERLVENHPWTGTATDLLRALPGEASDLGETSNVGWPIEAAPLSSMLRRLAPNLSAIGIEVEFSKSKGSRSKRLITIKKHGRD